MFSPLCWFIIIFQTVFHRLSIFVVSFIIEVQAQVTAAGLPLISEHSTKSLFTYCFFPLLNYIVYQLHHPHYLKKLSHYTSVHERLNKLLEKKKKKTVSMNIRSLNINTHLYTQGETVRSQNLKGEKDFK